MSWFRQIFGRRAIYDDLSEELHEHLEEKTQQIMHAEGVTRSEALAAASRAFGNRTAIEQRSRRHPAIFCHDRFAVRLRS